MFAYDDGRLQQVVAHGGSTFFFCGSQCKLLAWVEKRLFFFLNLLVALRTMLWIFRSKAKEMTKKITINGVSILQQVLQ